MKLSLFALICLIATPLLSQSLEKYDSLIFNEEITCLCVNVRQELFVGISSGEILKLSNEGETMEQFSYPNLGKPAKINCANPLKVFVFFEDTQRYLFIDRFTASPAIYEMQLESFKRAEYLSLAADQSLWSVTSPDLALNRHQQNTSQQLYLLSALIQPYEDIKNLLSIGNRILLQTSEKLYFFNLAGQLIQERLYAFGDISVARNKGYYIDPVELQLKPVTEDQNSKPVEIPTGYQSGVLLSKDKMVLVTENGLDFYFIR